MDVNTFYKKHHQNMKYEAAMSIKRYRVPSYLLEDCINAGYIHVCRYLPRWDNTRGANPMTYMLKGIRKEMNGICRGHLHHQPQNYRVNAERYVFELDEDSDYSSHADTSDTCSLSIEEKMDVRRFVQANLHMRPKQMSRLMLFAFDKTACTDIGRHEGISRQAVYYSVHLLKRRMNARRNAEADIS